MNTVIYLRKSRADEEAEKPGEFEIELERGDAFDD